MSADVHFGAHSIKVILRMQETWMDESCLSLQRRAALQYRDRNDNSDSNEHPTHDFSHIFNFCSFFSDDDFTGVSLDPSDPLTRPPGEKRLRCSAGTIRRFTIP